MRWKVAILTCSDEDISSDEVEASAQVIRELMEEEIEAEVIDYRIVPDEVDEIMAALIEMTAYYQPHLILTTGGIGLSHRDVTPEATREVVDRETPGIAEAMRAGALQKERRAMLSRGVAGIRGRTLIINLPGSPEGVHWHLQAIMDQLPLALMMLSGRAE